MGLIAGYSGANLKVLVGKLGSGKSPKMTPQGQNVEYHKIHNIHDNDDLDVTIVDIWILGLSKFLLRGVITIIHPVGSFFVALYRAPTGGLFSMVDYISYMASSIRTVVVKILFILFSIVDPLRDVGDNTATLRWPESPLKGPLLL